MLCQTPRLGSSSDKSVSRLENFERNDTKGGFDEVEHCLATFRRKDRKYFCETATRFSSEAVVERAVMHFATMLSLCFAKLGNALVNFDEGSWRVSIEAGVERFSTSWRI